jgi:hypothetical protein
MNLRPIGGASPEIMTAVDHEVVPELTTELESATTR